jgi:hypothetical protein
VKPKVVLTILSSFCFATTLCLTAYRIVRARKTAATARTTDYGAPMEATHFIQEVDHTGTGSKAFPSTFEQSMP